MTDQPTAGTEEYDITITRVFEAPRENVWKPERLVLTFSDQPGDDTYELVTVVLTELDEGRTEMIFRQRGNLPAEVYERTEEGWGIFFDRIAERLARA